LNPEKPYRPDRLSMVLLTDIDAFEQNAIAMLRASPKKTRFTTKHRKTGPVFTLKITDGRQSYKMKITKQEGIRPAQKVIATIMHLMTSPELIQ
jgi:hypothetical protein